MSGNRLLPDFCFLSRYNFIRLKLWRRIVKKIVSIESMRKIEAAADASGLTYDIMMENAGRAAALRVVDILDEIKGHRVTMLIGAGNNGGDGLVAARYINDHENTRVSCYLLNRRAKTDPNFKAIQGTDILIAYADNDEDGTELRQMIHDADIVVDALFGIGVRLPIMDSAADVLYQVNEALKMWRADHPNEETVFPANPAKSPPSSSKRVLALDCPSGLDCDSGLLDANAISADETITFIAAKPGLLTFPGANAVGNLSIASIDIPPNLPELLDAPWAIATAHGVKKTLPNRAPDSHKGTYGKAMIVAGSVNYTGAPGLAAEGAYRAGAGLVTVSAPVPVVNILAARLSEPTWLMLPHDMGVISETAASLILKQIHGYKALLLGPGWGTEETTGNMLKQLLNPPETIAKHHKKPGIGFTSPARQSETDDEGISLPPLVIDADGLNLLAGFDEWWTLLPEGTIITPHPGEMSKLANLETKEIQNNRWKVASAKAKEWSVVLVLKGAHTLIAAPSGQLIALPFKTDALATAGTGDILAGLIVGFLAQGMNPFDAAVTGGYIHGLAGELASKTFGSGRGIIASDILAIIRNVWQIIEDS